MKKREDIIAEVKIALIGLDVEGYREIADYCEEFADSLEQEAMENVARER